MKNQKKRIKERREKLLSDILSFKHRINGRKKIMEFSVIQFVEIHVMPALERSPDVNNKLYLFYFSTEIFDIDVLIGP